MDVNGTRSVSRRWRTVALLAIGVAIGAMLTATPVYSHVGGTVAHLWTKHIRPKTDARYYKKAQSEARYVNVGEKAASAAQADTAANAANAGNANLLDGVDSTGFYATGSKVADANLLDGIDSTTFLRGIEIVSGTTTFTATVTKQLNVTCPAGKKVVGGGATWTISNVGIRPVIRVSWPNTPTSWFAAAENLGITGADWGLSVYAVCVSAP